MERQRLRRTSRRRIASAYQVSILARNDPISPSHSSAVLQARSWLGTQPQSPIPSEPDLSDSPNGPLDSAFDTVRYIHRIRFRPRENSGKQAESPDLQRPASGCPDDSPFWHRAARAPSLLSGSGRSTELSERAPERVVGIALTSAGGARRAPDLRACRRSRRCGPRLGRPQWSSQSPTPAVAPNPRPPQAASASSD